MSSHRMLGLRSPFALTALLTLLLFTFSTPSIADEVVLSESVAEAVEVQVTPAQPAQPPEAAQPSRGGKRGGKPGAPPNAQPGQPPEGAKPEGEQKKEGEEGEKKDKPPATTVKRPDKPPRAPDPREFDVKLDDKGRVPPFNFIGQPWPDVLQWLASVSKCSLDWQELPNDYLNLTTQRPYTVDEVRDLVNRHLGARGYAAIQSGEVLSIFKIDKIDPSLVRRVAEDQLYDLKPYDFVKVSFELPAEMQVDKAKDDVKQLLNPTAKIFPLVATRRLLIMDTVANLRNVSEMLNQERLVADGKIVPKEFVLKHARPEKVIDILYVVLGMDPKSRPTQMDLQLQQQKLQIMAQMQQRGTDVSKMLKPDGPPVYLAFNRQRNSVLVNAPPEQLKVIEQTIQYLDVPFGSDGTPSGIAANASSERVTKSYRLTTLDIDRFVSMLEEVGGLSPTAEFKVDDDSKTLFAVATPADQNRISDLLKQFDGAGRKFEVIQLRRLPADAMAASINNLMSTQTEKKGDSDRYSNPWESDYGYGGYGYGGGGGGRKKSSQKAFGVEADVEHNRLVLWANDSEMERVRELLTKLGEISGPAQVARPVRIVAPTDAEGTAVLLQKLRAAWPQDGNQLIIKAPPPKPSAPVEKPATTEPPKTDPAATDKDADKKKSEKAVQRTPLGKISAKFVQLDAAAAREAAAPTSTTSAPSTESPAAAAAPAATSADTSDSAPPVTITVTDDGRLLLSSNDSAALDQLEQMIEELTPAQKRFKVFACKYIRASEMWYDLTDFFKEDLSGDKETEYDYSWYPPRPVGSKSKPSEISLGKRRKLMITYDRPSNSILVANASPNQLAEIEQLMAQFDKPSGTDSVEVRQTAAIKIRYSRPSIIAAAVKEVYRDLLSKRDKEFDRNDKREERSSSEHMTVISYSGAGDDSARPTPVKIGFDGALSLGADDISGVLIVSAQKALFDDIVRMIRELDNEAAPKTTVQVHHVNGNVSAKSIQQALDKAVGKAWLGNRPEQQPNQTGQEGNNKRQRNNQKGEQQQPKAENNNAEAATSE